MAMFEYVTETVDTRKEDRILRALEKRGAEGWELVSVVESGAAQIRMFFKRPATDGARAAA